MTAIHTHIERCRGCHAYGARLEPVLTMEPMPLAGAFCGTATEAASAPVFPLTWMHCSACGLLQVLEDVPGEFLFSKYIYSSSTIGSIVRHFSDYAEFLIERYGATSKTRFLEIGCNDGVLLTRLPGAWKLTGCDPSDVAWNEAVSSYQLINAPFDIERVQTYGLEGETDVISASNCLAHISDIKGVFDAAWLALRPAGEFWIEVHDLDALLRGNQWDTIYHEHKAEWSEESLVRCMQRSGFQHKETHRTPMHGGALRICFEKTQKPTTTPNTWVMQTAGLAGLRNAYGRRYETGAARTLRRMADAGSSIGAYGAAGRAVVYLNQTRDLRFEYVVDESPLRVGKFIPGIATPVVAPELLYDKPITGCLVTAWNYFEDIVQKHPGYKGLWIAAFGTDLQHAVRRFQINP